MGLLALALGLVLGLVYQFWWHVKPEVLKSGLHDPTQGLLQRMLFQIGVRHALAQVPPEVSHAAILIGTLKTSAMAYREPEKIPYDLKQDVDKPESLTCLVVSRLKAVERASGDRVTRRGLAVVTVAISGPWSKDRMGLTQEPGPEYLRLKSTQPPARSDRALKPNASDSAELLGVDTGISFFDACDFSPDNFSFRATATFHYLFFSRGKWRTRTTEIAFHAAGVGRPWEMDPEGE
jgi:hypothetical protein